MALLAGGIALAADTKPQSVIADRIVAVVNDQIILLSELASQSIPFEERAAQDATDAIGRSLARKQVRQKILDDMIGDKLVEGQARELQITVSDREIDTEIARIKKENNLDDATFYEQMKQQGMDEKALRDLIRRQKQRQKVIEVRVQPRISVTDAEVRAYYNENYTNDDEVHLYLISKRLPQAATADETKKIREQMETLRSQVTTGGKDFEAVAKNETEGPNKQGGGDIGWAKRGEISAEIEQVAFALQPGDVSSVVSFGGALHLVKVKERKAAPAKPLDQVQDKIRGVLFSRAAEKEYERWIAELRARSFVEVRLDGPIVEDTATPTPASTPKLAPKDPKK